MKIRPKKLHHSEAIERKASWLELFFDLSLVVPVYQLSHYLAEHLSFMGILVYGVLFMAVLQSWQHHVYYNEQFSLPEKVMRGITLVKLLLLICMTAFIPTALGDGKLGFILIFCTIRLFMTGLWEWSAFHNPQMAALTRQYSRGTLVGTLLLVVSLWLPQAWTIVFWVSAILLDAVLPTLMFRRHDSAHLSLSNHLPERFGLFFLILLGEGIISITLALLNNNNIFLQVIPAAALGLFLIFGIWWLYIDTIMAKPIRRDSMPHTILWQEGHVGLMLILPALGASIAILLENTSALQKSSILFVALVVGAILFFFGIIERALRKDIHTPCQCSRGLSYRIIGVVLLALLLWIPATWPSWVVFLVLNGIVWGQVIVADGYETKKSGA